MTPFYAGLCAELRSLTDGVSHLISNLSNSSALIFERISRLNWAGFYLPEGGTLVLGPFQGKPACIEIPFGRGVCGTAAKELRTIVVPDVHCFPGHIACDSDSLSEIVVPLVRDGILLGVLDIDSPEKNRFSDDDKEGIEELAKIITVFF
jgi:GAF domain-containing protein